MITFKEDTELEIIERYNEDADCVEEESTEIFKANVKVDADIVFEDEEGNMEIQFGDGSIAFCNRKDLI